MIELMTIFPRGLVSEKKNGAITQTTTSVERVAKAAPKTPIVGIKTKLSTTLRTAPIKVKCFTYLFFPSDNIQILLVIEVTAKTVDHAKIIRGAAAGKYASPYKICIAILPNTDNTTATPVLNQKIVLINCCNLLIYSVSLPCSFSSIMVGLNDLIIALGTNSHIILTVAAVV